MIDIQYKSREDLDIEYDPKIFKNASNLMMWCFYVKMPDQITLTSINESSNNLMFEDIPKIKKALIHVAQNQRTKNNNLLYAKQGFKFKVH